MLLIATVSMLGGCGSSPPRLKTTPTALPALGQSIDQLGRLVVSRTDRFPSNQIRFTFPATVVVTDRAAVQAVARALCALPQMPSGTMFCPIDFGIIYHLVFTAGGRSFSVVSIDVGGCETVRGLGATRWLMKSPGFWHMLGMAMGLSKPGYATFRGSLPMS